ncbi:hypothetical protein ACET3Z_006371 [Daucus carota]
MSLIGLPNLFGVKSHQENPMVSAIPVPAAVKVSSHADIDYVPFRRPESYITCKDDELTRVLGRESSVYEMDFHSRRDDHCISLGRRDVLRTIYSYWIKKRKQKRSALVKVFLQLYQSRTRVLRKADHGKKRSLTREARENVIREKRATVLQAEEKKKELKIALEAGAALTRLDDVALGKRKRAQMLMEVADKCTYKATMALRISKAIGQGKSLVDVANQIRFVVNT